MKLIIDPLTPSEAAEVTGVSLENQRNLRKQGYLPKNKGHARFTLLEVCRLLVVGSLSARGIGPKVAFTFADTAALGIMLGVIWSRDIYDDDAFEAALDATKDNEMLSKSHAEKSVDFEVTDKMLRELHRSFAARHLAELLEADLGAAGSKPPVFFVYWANGHPEFFYGDDHPFEDHLYGHAAWQGPAIMLSIGGMAALLASRLPHPIVHVEKATD